MLEENYYMLAGKVFVVEIWSFHESVGERVVAPTAHRPPGDRR